ncbi:MAG: hypothetical protein D6748_05985 [Calditrichaeota bacterium]|nr:MAG: hypothetical protein D6748_05985 [Calditrichota bacterium]
MMQTDFTNRIRVQTNQLPKELTHAEIDETARSIALFYKSGEFICQTFFTPPLLGKINWVDGLDTSAQVYFREINFIVPNLLHLRLVGDEKDIREMCRNERLYDLLKGIQSTYTEEIRSRRYLDTTVGKQHWDLIVSLDKRNYWFANNVNYKGSKTRIDHVLIVGDRLLGLTESGEVIYTQLTPEVLEKEDLLLDVQPMEEVNKLGKVDLLEAVPNSDETFLVTIKNRVYQFTIWGDMVHFDMLDEKVERINSINFNNTRTIIATTDGIYELDVIEMPNMVKPTSLPRQIANPHLKTKFKTALYVEDPYILGVHPAMGVFAKTEDEKVVFF